MTKELKNKVILSFKILMYVLLCGPYNHIVYIIVGLYSRLICDAVQLSVKVCLCLVLLNTVSLHYKYIHGSYSVAITFAVPA